MAESFPIESIVSEWRAKQHEVNEAIACKVDITENI